MDGDGMCRARTQEGDEKYQQNFSLRTYWDTTCDRAWSYSKKTLRWMFQELRPGFGLSHLRMGASGEIL